MVVFCKINHAFQMMIELLNSNRVWNEVVWMDELSKSTKSCEYESLYFYHHHNWLVSDSGPCTLALVGKSKYVDFKKICLVSTLYWMLLGPPDNRQAGQFLADCRVNGPIAARSTASQGQNWRAWTGGPQQGPCLLKTYNLKSGASEFEEFNHC